MDFWVSPSLGVSDPWQWILVFSLHSDYWVLASFELNLLCYFKVEAFMCLMILVLGRFSFPMFGKDLRWVWSCVFAFLLGIGFGI